MLGASFLGASTWLEQSSVAALGSASVAASSFGVVFPCRRFSFPDRGVGVHAYLLPSFAELTFGVWVTCSFFALRRTDGENAHTYPMPSIVCSRASCRFVGILLLLYNTPICLRGLWSLVCSSWFVFLRVGGVLVGEAPQLTRRRALLSVFTTTGFHYSDYSPFTYSNKSERPRTSLFFDPIQRTDTEKMHYPS